MEEQPKVLPSQFSLQAIFNSIKNLLANDELSRQNATRYLESLENLDLKHLVQSLIELSIAKQLAAMERQICLLYLRHIINSSKQIWGDYIYSFDKLVDLVSVQLQQLAYTCLVNYLNKPRVAKIKRLYIQLLLSKLTESLTSNQAQNRVITRIIKILGHSNMTRRSGNNFGNSNQKTIHLILTKYCVSCPFINVSYNEWVSLILALCNFTGFTPTNHFVYTNLIKQGIGYTHDLLILVDLYNKMSYKYTILSQMWDILQVQLGRIGDAQFIQYCSSTGNSRCFTAFIKSIQNVLKGLLMIEENDNLDKISQLFFVGQQEQIKAQIKNQNESKILASLTNKQFFTNLLSKLFVISSDMQLQQKMSIISLMNSVLQRYHQLGLKSQETSQYIRHLITAIENYGLNKQKCTQICYWMLGNMRSTWLSGKFGKQMLCHAIAVFKSNIAQQSEQNVEYIMQMVKNYLKCFPKWNQQDEHIGRIMDMTRFYLQDNLHNDNYSVQAKVYAFSVMCTCQICRAASLPEHNHNFKILQLGFKLMGQLIGRGGSADMQCDIESIELLLESMNQLCSATKDLNYFKTQLSKILKFCLTNVRKHSVVQILLVRYLALQLKYEHISPEFLEVINYCFLPRNEPVMMEACNFVLLLLVKSNQVYMKMGSDSWETAKVISQSGILQFIQLSLIQDFDEAIFTKIMLELVIHPAPAQKIYVMLNRIVGKVPERVIFCYYFDRVWEAICIVYKINNEYTQKKGIDDRVRKICGGDIQSMLQNLKIQQDLNDSLEEAIINRNFDRKNIKWSQLPEVRRVLSYESVVGEFIQDKIKNFHTNS